MSKVWPWYVAGVKQLDGGICKCAECGEILLEDERHWHLFTKENDAN